MWALPTKTLKATPRVRWIDSLRGLGILLMVLDHLLMLVAPHSFVRYTVTRLSLPCLMMAAGWMNQRKPTSLTRIGETLWAGLIGTLVFAKIGAGIPDPLFVAGFSLGVLSVLMRLLGPFGALVAVAIGVTQFYAWPLPVTGYQPGVMLSLAGAAASASTGSLLPLSRSMLRVPTCVAWFGRHPVFVYLAHLPILLALSRAT